MRNRRNVMGYVLRKKTREIIVLCRINRYGGATLATLLKNRAERYAGTCMLLRNNRNGFGCRNNINISGFLLKKCIYSTTI